MVRIRRFFLMTTKGFSVKLERGDPAVAKRILELLADGPMRPSALRKAVGIRSSIHFNRYYLSPLQEKGIIARTDPDHPHYLNKAARETKEKRP